ncbi:MAG TPA: hypothetical protein VN605_06995, partial [Thermoanaerobaculia bacterium]|nr:hypothetical protein [Thermoanaerobaculia bacterium]
MLTPIGVKTRQQRNLYVLIVYAPGSRGKVLLRRIARRPWARLEPGERLKIDARRGRLAVVRVREEVVRDGAVIEHRTHLFTRLVRVRRKRPKPVGALPDNVVAMPAARGAVVADFLRYHVLVRVYAGDVDVWIAHLETHRDDADGDLRFARALRARLRHDPRLLSTIRAMVDATPFWRAVV